MEKIRALVTGGSGDIGSAICHELAEQGLHVLVHGNRNRERAEIVAGEIRQIGGSAEAICFDLADGRICQSVIKETLRSGAIQVLVSNAGVHDDAPLAGMGFERWEQVIDINLHGFHRVCQPLLLPMLRTRWGRVIAISSIAGQVGNRGQANYAAAKAGLHGAIKSLSIELASRGITANVVAPGIIAGQMSNETFDEAFIRQNVPAGRMGRPEEVASLVGFLTSEQASYISGQIIGVNGGMY
jgi:3-oxoacyl-[acyl-carrier protein] reductase